ncbi:spore protease YyaC [Cohnella herbarum]|uniref:Spore protease YyaC n=1 Tax=Cohnella herbarum TaxID=2728023 RepID=A0A7Z2VR37_9BACL|nr:spore protease YyaC [Cohnella herbarum]QJD87732.1 spore protease YyaC [Cohnella herbarum]
MTILNVPSLLIGHTDPAASMRMTNRLAGHFKPLPSSKRIVVVCIGSDRCTGDSLGPLTGSLLGKYRSTAFDLFGTLEKPVHAMNLDATLEKLNTTIDDPFVVGIDACLGNASSIGMIQIGDGPLRPGAGVNKTLPPVGDIHISAIVNIGGILGFQVLQNTRLHLVMSMASLISKSLFVAISVAAREDRIQYGIQR